MSKAKKNRKSASTAKAEAATAPAKGLPVYHPVFLIATWFGIGKIKYAPGSFGALAALPFSWALYHYTGIHGLLYASIALFIIGVIVSNIYMERMQTEHDAKEIVVDEVVGMWLLTLVFLPSINAYIAAFFLFRLFDIWKPWPISWVDQKIKGGIGVMADDFFAAIIPGFLFALFIGLCKAFGWQEWLNIVIDLLYPDGTSPAYYS